MSGGSGSSVCVALAVFCFEVELEQDRPRQEEGQAMELGSGNREIGNQDPNCTIAHGAGEAQRNWSGTYTLG